MKKLAMHAESIWLSIRLAYLNWKQARLRRGNMKLARRVEYLEAEIEQGPARMRQRLIDAVEAKRKKNES